MPRRRLGLVHLGFLLLALPRLHRCEARAWRREAQSQSTGRGLQEALRPLENANMTEGGHHQQTLSFATPETALSAPWVLTDSSPAGSRTPRSIPKGPPTLSKEAWDPQPGKYLLAMCMYGGLSNQLICMRSYLELAQVLNRSLLVPTWGVDPNTMWRAKDKKFEWSLVVNWKRMQRCLAPKYGPVAVVTTGDYLAIHKTDRVNVDLFAPLSRTKDFALGGYRAPLFGQVNQDIRLPEWGLIRDTPLVPNITNDKVAPWDVVRYVGPVQDNVITFGEMFNTGLHYSPPPLKVVSQDCNDLWKCHSGILEAVRGLGTNALGNNYAALHLRRGNFYYFFAVVTHSLHGAQLAKRGFKSIQELATELRESLKRLGITRLFLATNARKLEIELFTSILQDTDNLTRVQQVVTLNDLLGNREWLGKQPWAQKALELEREPNHATLVFALMDKFMCVEAKHFFGSPLSTFSMDIKEHRDEDTTGPKTQRLPIPQS